MKEATDTFLHDVLIRCSDAGIWWLGPEESKQWDLTTPFQYTGWRGKDGELLTSSMSSHGDSLPRGTACEQKKPIMWTLSYSVSHVSGMRVFSPGTEQSLIMICTDWLYPLSVDPRTGGPGYDDRFVSGHAVACKPSLYCQAPFLKRL
jgi:hypothetical protein